MNHAVTLTIFVDDDEAHCKAIEIMSNILAQTLPKHFNLNSGPLQDELEEEPLGDWGEETYRKRGIDSTRKPKIRQAYASR